MGKHKTTDVYPDLSEETKQQLSELGRLVDRTREELYCYHLWLTDKDGLENTMISIKKSRTYPDSWGIEWYKGKVRKEMMIPFKDEFSKIKLVPQMECSQEDEVVFRCRKLCALIRKSEWIKDLYAIAWNVKTLMHQLECFLRDDPEDKDLPEELLLKLEDYEKLTSNEIYKSEYLLFQISSYGNPQEG